MGTILLLNYEYPPLGGGAGHVSQEIALWYVKKGFKVDVFTMGFPGLPEYEVQDGITIHRIKSYRKKIETCSTFEMLTFVISAIIYFRTLGSVNEYDIVHCHFLIPTGLVALYLKHRYNLDYIVTIHGSDVPGYNPDRFKIEHFFTKPIIAQICQEAKAICSPSIYLRDLLEARIGCHDIEYIPNGIDLNKFKLDLSKPKKNLILSTGRLLERKGFQTLIKAVKDTNLPFEVHIVGDGPYRTQLEKLAEGSKTKIIFHGWLDRQSKEFIRLYEVALVYVLVSSRENASIALLEGMAAGCVMISTNVSGCRETVGDAGFLIDYGDDKALKELLRNLSENKEKLEYFSKKSLARLDNFFSWEKSIKKYIDLITRPNS